MSVTVDKNYNIVVTPEYWQTDLKKNFDPIILDIIMRNIIHSSSGYNKAKQEYNQIYEELEKKFGNENDWPKEFWKSEEADKLKKAQNKLVLEYTNTDNYHEGMKRFWRVWKTAGKPYLTSDNPEQSYHDELKLFPRAYTYSNINPSHKTLSNKKISKKILDFSKLKNMSNSAYAINNFKDAIAEISHPIQEIYGENLETSNQEDLLNYPNNIEDKYNDPYHYEYETHSIIQPQLENFILEGILPNFPIYKQGGKLIPRKKRKY